jgi:hypothetical protein
MPESDQEVVLEARRRGRRPRYHRGVVLVGSAVRLDAPQCNLDQVGIEVRRLEGLPEGIRRPWAQLCRRCWAGTAVYDAALAARPLERLL